jgi:hypothetical protein
LIEVERNNSLPASKLCKDLVLRYGVDRCGRRRGGENIIEIRFTIANFCRVVGASIIGTNICLMAAIGGYPTGALKGDYRLIVGVQNWRSQFLQIKP